MERLGELTALVAKARKEEEDARVAAEEEAARKAAEEAARQAAEAARKAEEEQRKAEEEAARKAEEEAASTLLSQEDMYMDITDESDSEEWDQVKIPVIPTTPEESPSKVRYLFLILKIYLP